MGLALLLAGLLAAPHALVAPHAPPPFPGDLRTEIEAAVQDGLSVAELEAFSHAALTVAESASSNADFWSATGLLAELCRRAPFAAAHAPRARALALLARRDADSMRWSSLVTQQFLPNFAEIPRDAWSHELAEYDRALDELAGSAISERARAELGFAKAFARVFIDRRWDWLDEARRLEAIELLATLRARFGDLPIPGGSAVRSETSGTRAAACTRELEELHFGAPAPPTAGVDLDGRALDLADDVGRLVVLDFWTSFCQPCLAMVPSTRRLLDEFADEPVVFVGVCGDPDRQAGKATAERVGMTWRSLWDGPLGTDGPAATTWNVNAVGWPTVIVLDARGRIRVKLHGKEQIEAELEGALRGLLAEVRGVEPRER